jgi:hypothetical protein
MAQFEPLLWDRRARRIRRLRTYPRSISPIDPGIEFEGPEVGRLGRRLLTDVEGYLEFFALARQPAQSPDPV